MKMYFSLIILVHTHTHTEPENAFQINHCDKSFHVYAHSKADKSNWISNLNKQISKINKGQSVYVHVIIIVIISTHLIN